MAYVNESWHMWMSHGICEWVMAYVNESWHMWMSHGICEWVIHMCHDSNQYAMTHPYVPWLIHIYHDPNTTPWLITHCQIIGRHDSFMYIMNSYVPWLIHVYYEFIRAITHSYVPWLIPMCHDSFIRVMTHSHGPWRSTHSQIIGRPVIDGSRLRKREGVCLHTNSEQLSKIRNQKARAKLSKGVVWTH